MAELHTLARPYAKAAFELARESGALPHWSKMLNALADLVGTAQIAAVIGRPDVSRADLGGLLTASLGDVLDTQGRNFVRLLAENNRVVLAAAIAAEFEALRAEAEKRIDVEIATAAPVDTAQQKTLTDAIAKRLSREVDVSWTVDESLIAGAMIRTGDLVIDGSAVGELDRLRQALAA